MRSLEDEAFSIDRQIQAPQSISDGFSLIMDGMILDVVGELLKHDDSMVEVIRRARLTYKQGIEDFGFVVVYASKILTATDVTDRSNDPGRYSRADIVHQLKPIWQYHLLADELKFGAILQDRKIRNVIRQDIAAVSRCVEKEGWAFRDWFLGEAPRHLGKHASLFDEGVGPSDYVLKAKVLEHYRDEELQRSIGPHALAVLTGYLADATVGPTLNYTQPALREFASRSVMGLVT